MFLVLGGHFFHALFKNIFKSSIRISCFVGGEVHMTATAVPVTKNGLWVEVHSDAEFLTESVEKVSREPHVVSALNTLGNTDLVFPLARGDFSVSSSNAETSRKHASEKGFNYRSAESCVVSHTAVVSALRPGEPILGPAKRPFMGGAGSNKEEELLLKTKPWVMFLGLLHNFVANVSEIVSGGSSSVRKECFTKDKDGVVATERVFAEENRLQVNLALGGGGLLAAGTIEGPLLELLKSFDFLVVNLS